MRSYCPRLFEIAEKVVPGDLPLRDVGEFLAKHIGFREVDGNETCRETLLEMEEFLKNGA